MSWLQKHLEEFVVPVLGYIPEKSESRYFSEEEMIAIKSIWKSVKRQAVRKQLVLTGRDTYIFEVLARRENYPTVYIPQCSRVTKHKVDIPIKGCLFFDTGFAGSIPKFYDVDYILLSEEMRDVRRQVFPAMGMARALAMKIEYSPKYWESGRLIDGEVVMKNTDSYSIFKAAAQLTIEVYTDSTPMRDLKPRRRMYGRPSYQGMFDQSSQEDSFADLFA